MRLDLPQLPFFLNNPRTTSIVALVAGVVILFQPELLSFVVAFYLIWVGIQGLLQRY